MSYKPGDKYRPSNGTEGDGFMGKFCDECERDRPYREEESGSEPCPILCRAFAFAVDHPDFPAEWTYTKAGEPTCTAFVPEGKPVPTELELEAQGQGGLFDAEA